MLNQLGCSAVVQMLVFFLQAKRVNEVIVTAYVFFYVP